VSCVPRVASFSGLSIVFFVLYVFVLCLVFLVLPVSLDYPLCFLFCMSSSCVWCSSCCQFLWIIHCGFCFVCLRPVSRVPRVASFSGLSILDCLFIFLSRLLTYLVGF
jgi:hypothetical protein